MNIFTKFCQRQQEKSNARNQLCNNLISELEIAKLDFDSIFSDKSKYIDTPVFSQLIAKWDSLSQEATKIYNSKSLKRADNNKGFIRLYEIFNQYYTNLKSQIISHNQLVTETKIEVAYQVINQVENRQLDRQQMQCIVKEMHNHLIIAGAGTGKTTTIIGKIKYMLSMQQCEPQDILVLSFTKASATEMKQRIMNEVGVEIEVSTFHKLGLNIITSVEGIIPKITQINLRKYSKDKIMENMKKPHYISLLCTYLLFNKVYAKSEFEFNSQTEYSEYLHNNPPITMKNEIVKSYGEMDIANFLLQQGISYIYENSYIIDTRNTEYGQYYPDFYLPDYNIYIEYFGINRKGEVPEYFSAKPGKTASQSYKESMEWKRKLHNQNNTILIECYSYEKFEGVLLDQLKTHLQKYHVTFKPKPVKDLWKEIASDEKSIINAMAEQFETIINLMKSNAYDVENVRKLNTKCGYTANNIIIDLVEPIFTAYQSELKQAGEIDFNDMINQATDYVKQNKYIHSYHYVIVDEYQDISKSRYLLLKALRDSKDYALFCVGDDWQSIYRFAGSDIGFILNFYQYWGDTELSKIETTYRFSNSLIQISGNFVMKNPKQIKKSIKGINRDGAFALDEISGYKDVYAVNFMLDKLNDLPRNSSVFFIGRYHFDYDLLCDNGNLRCNYNNASKEFEICYPKRADLKMIFLSAHKSKGLQADYVFIINNKKTGMGFPSNIQDSPIIQLLLENSDDYPFSEERRLFYVAMTRAKKKVFLLTVHGNESEFVIELKNQYSKELKREHFTCPECGGRLVKRSGPYGDFFGCSNYKNNGCTYKRK